MLRHTLNVTGLSHHSEIFLLKINSKNYFTYFSPFFSRSHAAVVIFSFTNYHYALNPSHFMSSQIKKKHTLSYYVMGIALLECKSLCEHIGLLNIVPQHVKRRGISQQSFLYLCRNILSLHESHDFLQTIHRALVLCMEASTCHLSVKSPSKHSQVRP